MAIEKQKLTDMYIMVRHREFEERVAKEFEPGNVVGFRTFKWR